MISPVSKFLQSSLFWGNFWGIYTLQIYISHLLHWELALISKKIWKGAMQKQKIRRQKILCLWGGGLAKHLKMISRKIYRLEKSTNFSLLSNFGLDLHSDGLVGRFQKIFARTFYIINSLVRGNFSTYLFIRSLVKRVIVKWRSSVSFAVLAVTVTKNGAGGAE